MSRKWGFAPFLAAGLFAAVGSFSAMPVLAQGTPAAQALPTNPVIAIIDHNRILQETSAAKGLLAQADKYERQLNDDGNKLQSDLEAQQRQIGDQRANLSQQDFEAKVRDFNQNAQNQQNNLLLRRRALQESEGQVQQKLKAAVAKSARDVAVSKGANFVFENFPDGPWLLYDQTADITSAVIALMNKNTPQIEFPVPKVDPAQLKASAPPASASKTAPQSKAAVPKFSSPSGINLGPSR